MDSFSPIHWLIVLLFLGVPIYVFVRYYKIGTRYILSPDGITAGQAAGPWSRYFARMFDLAIAYIMIGIVLAVLGVKLDFRDASTSDQAASFIEGLILTPFALLIDAIAIGMVGTTPGKAMFGIRVHTPQGLRLSVAQALDRNFKMWFFGLTLGVPLYVLLALILNFRKVRRGKRVSWDQDHGYNVTQEGVGTGRIAIGIVVSLIVILGIFALSILS